MFCGYIAGSPDLEACSAFGATAEEALAEVEKAKEASSAREPPFIRWAEVLVEGVALPYTPVGKMEGGDVR